MASLTLIYFSSDKLIDLLSEASYTRHSVELSSLSCASLVPFDVTTVWLLLLSTLESDP